MNADENNQLKIGKSGRGGKRPGAGRKLGSATKKTREIADRAAKEGITPLEYMLKVLRDEGEDGARRLDAAKSAAPYVHARLASTELHGKMELGVTVLINKP